MLCLLIDLALIVNC